MLSALGVIILAIGSIFDVVDLSVAVIASLLCVYAVIEMGGIYPWMIWIVTSLVALLLLPVKTPAIFYAVAFGFYPMVKEKAEKKSNTVCWIIKIITFHIAMALMLLGLWLFVPAMLDGMFRLLMLAFLYVGALAVFIVYDMALTRLITLYFARFRHRFRLK